MTAPDPAGTWERPLAVVTGAAGGMGRTIARRLGTRYRLAVVDVRQDAVTALGAALDEEGFDVVLAAAVDITDRVAVEALATSVDGAGRLGTLVHTAGLSPALAGWESIVRVNLAGTAHLLDAFVALAQPGGSAVCLASLAAHTFPATAELDAVLDDPTAPDLLTRLAPLLAEPDTEPSAPPHAGLAYSASKRGVVRLVEQRVDDWAERGARILSLSPGVIRTPMGRREMEANPRAAATASVTPLRRLGTPADIAAAVDFLSSDLASYITGCDIRIDGGATAARTRGVGRVAGRSGPR